MSLATYGPYALEREIARSALTVGFMARFLPSEEEEPRWVRVRFYTEQALRRPELLDRMKDALEIATRLNHVNVAQTFDLAVDGPRVYSVHEFVDGISLKRLLEAARAASRPIPPDVAAFLVAEICAGVAYAHGRRDARGQALGIVHTDIRPSNLLVSGQGEVKLADTGHARARLEVEGEAELRRADRLQYAAPELARLEAWDQRADVFSLGAILYTLLAGRSPYEGMTGAELLSYARRGDVEPLSRVASGVPEDLYSLVDEAMALDPAQRVASAQAFRSSLAAWLRTHAPGFGRHRLKTWIQKELPSLASSLSTLAAGSALPRREYVASDPASLLEAGDGRFSHRDPVEDLLAGTRAAPRAAATAPTAERVAGAAPRPPSLPTRQPGLSTRPAPPPASTQLFEEVEDASIPDDNAGDESSAPARPPAEGPAAGVIIATDPDDAPLPAAPIPRPPEPVLGDARRIAAARSGPEPEATNDDSEEFDPDALASEVWQDGENIDALPEPEPDAPIRRAFPWKTALVSLAGCALLGWGGLQMWDAMRAGSVSSQARVERDEVRIFVTSRPQGATVLVDGQPTELRTPALLPAHPIGAQILVELRLDGYTASAAQPVVVSIDTPELVFELTPTPHTVHLTSEPPGASVLVDGDVVGTTPLSVGPLRVDYRRGLAVLVSLDGYLDEVLSIDWSAGQTQSSYTVPLRPDPDWVAPPEAIDTL